MLFSLFHEHFALDSPLTVSAVFPEGMFTILPWPLNHKHSESSLPLRSGCFLSWKLLTYRSTVMLLFALWWGTCSFNLIFSLLNFQVVFPLFNDLQRDITKNCQDSPFWFLVMPWSHHIAGESCLCDLCCLDGLISYVKASLSGESGHFSLSQFSPFQCLHSVPHLFLLIMFRPQLLRCEMKSMAIYYGLWKTLRHGWADLPSILCEIWKDRQTD